MHIPCVAIVMHMRYKVWQLLAARTFVVFVATTRSELTQSSLHFEWKRNPYSKDCDLISYSVPDLGTMVRLHYLGQNYERLRKQAQTSGQLFEDPEFPATNASLYLGGQQKGRIEWKRPKEICADPHLVVGGVEGNDLNQGDVGNCWFVAACASLAQEKKLWNHVVPNADDQEWDEAHPEKYTGIFRFRFWRFGHLTEVVVDDRLPTMNGRLVYVHSKQRNEFWSPLLEKAYAKLSGCYEALDAGNTADAFVDFSGGVSESINLAEKNYVADEHELKLLFQKIHKAMSRQAMVSCSIRAEEGKRETRMDCGLVKGHAYCVTAMKEVVIQEGFFRDKKLMMVRVRNPWGGKEWNGAWSDGSREWQQVSDKEKKRIGLEFEDDGEFWMDIHDWCQQFTHLSLCRLINTSIFSLHKTWHETKYYGEWTTALSGGCVNNKQTFLSNPQFVFDVRHEGEGITMVSLQQQDRRMLKSHGGDGSNLTVGFHIMKAEENRQYRMNALHETAATVTYINSRSVFGRYELPEGRYVLLPTTFDPGHKGEFLLRIFTESDSRCKPLVHAVPPPIPWYRACFSRYPQAVVVVEIKGCDGLERQDISGGADPYVIVGCEGKKSRTPVKKNTIDPIFNSQLMFYPKNPRRSELLIQVWNKNVAIDSFMGQTTIILSVDGQTMQYTKPLLGRGSKRDQPTHGNITFTVSCSSNLKSV